MRHYWVIYRFIFRAAPAFVGRQIGPVGALS